MMAPASRIRSRTKGRSSMMEAPWAGALKASLSLGRTLLALRECFGTDTLGMRTRLIVGSGGGRRL